MYIEYFGLTEEPFSLASDPEFFYPSSSQKEALARLQFGIDLRKGLLILTGDVGSGKTIVIQTLVFNRKPDQNMALIVNPRVVGSRLIPNICRELGIELDFAQMSKSEIFTILTEYVLKKSFYDQNFIIIVDDAHELSPEQLDDILLLVKVETNTRQLIQVVLTGLPDLLDKLKSPERKPLYQRIQIHYHIKPFSYADTQNFILHRLAKSGLKKQEIFKADAIQRIHQLSGGIPRTICVIASNAMLYAFLKKIKKIDYQIVNSATDETLQASVDEEAVAPEVELKEKYPPRLKQKPQHLPKKRPWLTWALIALFLIIALIGLNILAEYLISYFNLF
ncbi:MAG: AAA family ATPase [Calditrichaeota bacterium]|nr:AAA family ATPase [Calditrichota bacterium]